MKKLLTNNLWICEIKNDYTLNSPSWLLNPKTASQFPCFKSSLAFLIDNLALSRLFLYFKQARNFKASFSIKYLAPKTLVFTLGYWIIIHVWLLFSGKFTLCTILIRYCTIFFLDRISPLYIYFVLHDNLTIIIKVKKNP